MSLKAHSKNCEDPHCSVCKSSTKKKKVDLTIEEMKVKLIDLIEKKPEKAAFIIQEWMKNSSK